MYKHTVSTMEQQGYTCALYLRRSPKTNDKFNCQILAWMTDMVPYMVKSGIVVNVKIISDSNAKELATKGITKTPAFVPHPSLIITSKESVIFGIDSIADFIEYHCTQKNKEEPNDKTDCAPSDLVHDMLMDAINSEETEDDEFNLDKIRKAMTERMSTMNTKEVQRNPTLSNPLLDRTSHTTGFGDSIDNNERLSTRKHTGISMVDVADDSGMDDAVRKFWENQEVTPM